MRNEEEKEKNLPLTVCFKSTKFCRKRPKTAALAEAGIFEPLQFWTSRTLTTFP